MIESKPVDAIGDKVCGNALTQTGLDAIAEHCAPPSGAEVAQELDGGLLLLADGRTELPLEAPGVVLNRHLFGQRMLADALAKGAELADACSCVGWHDRSAPAVRVREADGLESIVRARVVIDATGYRGVLTRRGGPSHRDPLTRADAGIAYREIVPLVRPLESPRRGLLALSPSGARGGYAWIFPMGERLANAGIGASLATAGRDLRVALRRFLDTREGVAATAPVTRGAGMLPLRRPLASLVGDGFLTVGDAACQANPLHGGGIAPSIIAGAIAGHEAARAVAEGDVSTAGLWPYAVSFMHGIGATNAAHEILRRMIHGLREDDFDHLCIELGRSGAMLKAVSARGPRLPLRTAMGVLGSAARRPALFRRLLQVVRLSEGMLETYRSYPESPERLSTWIGRVEYHLRTLDHLLGVDRRSGGPGGAARV